MNIWRHRARDKQRRPSPYSGGTYTLIGKANILKTNKNPVPYIITVPNKYCEGLGLRKKINEGKPLG